MSTESRTWLVLALVIAGGWLIYLLAPVITRARTSQVRDSVDILILP